MEPRVPPSAERDAVEAEEAGQIGAGGSREQYIGAREYDVRAGERAAGIIGNETLDRASLTPLRSAKHR